MKATGEFEKSYGLDKKLIDEILNVILKYTKPKKVIIFGSRARGENRKNSDIDLCVEFKNNLSFREKRKLKEELENSIKYYSFTKKIEFLFFLILVKMQ